MKHRIDYRQFVPFYALVLLGCLVFTAFGSRAVTVMQASTPLKNRHCIIVDAGHGGVDGGATSCTGVLESTINLEIAIRLNDLLHFLGYPTYMIRTEDISIHTKGDSIAAKKISDLKERVRIVNETNNALLISIHQNHFEDDRYAGAQVFYPADSRSESLGKSLQRTIVSALNPGSSRQAKKASGVYLMEHIENPGILIECGFLSNHQEEAKLRNPEYQKKLCCVIATTIGVYLDERTND